MPKLISMILATAVAWTALSACVSRTQAEKVEVYETRETFDAVDVRVQLRFLRRSRTVEFQLDWYPGVEVSIRGTARRMLGNGYRMDFDNDGFGNQGTMQWKIDEKARMLHVTVKPLHVADPNGVRQYGSYDLRLVEPE